MSGGVDRVEALIRSLENGETHFSKCFGAKVAKDLRELQAALRNGFENYKALEQKVERLEAAARQILEDGE